MSWKTSLAGVLSLVAATISLVALPILDADPTTQPNWLAWMAALAAAAGLVSARDNDKSSEDVGLKPRDRLPHE